jgi:hypothetical protein
LSYNFIFHKQFHSLLLVWELGHGNSDNNLESLCIFYVLWVK